MHIIKSKTVAEATDREAALSEAQRLAYLDVKNPNRHFVVMTEENDGYHVMCSNNTDEDRILVTYRVAH